MGNWIECEVCFADSDVPVANGSEGSTEGSMEGSEASLDDPMGHVKTFSGLVCSRCKLVKYCSADHQRRDWEEHKRVCAKPPEN